MNVLGHNRAGPDGTCVVNSVLCDSVRDRLNLATAETDWRMIHEAPSLVTMFFLFLRQVS